MRIRTCRLLVATLKHAAVICWIVSVLTKAFGTTDNAVFMAVIGLLVLIVSSLLDMLVDYREDELRNEKSA